MWLAEDRELGEQVALKVFGAPPSDAARERWQQEVRLGRRLQHPNLLRLHDLVNADGGLVAVMEFVDGGTLADRIEQGPLKIDEVVTLAEQMLDVLGYLHGEGIVHRDVKPSNIIFTGKGVPKLGDLGLVRELGSGLSLTVTKTTVGTPSYMAPEQLRGEAPEPAWDLYGLGVTLYEALTGRRPFEGESSFDVADGHLHRRAPTLRRLRRDCPVWLSRLVDRLLEKRAGRRWASAGEALAALRRRKVGRSPTARLRLVGLTVGVVMVVVAGLVGVNVLWSQRDVAEVAVVGNQVVAVDSHRRELWRRTRSPDSRAVVGDFLPRGGREVAVVGPAEPKGERDLPVALELIDAGGTTRDRRSLEAGWSWPVSRRFWQCAQMLAADLDGDGMTEAVLMLRHHFWYPSELQLLSRGQGRLQIVPILANSGALHAMAVADVNGDGVQDILAAGLNNPMGFQTFVAAVDGKRILGLKRAVSPDLAVDGGRGAVGLLDALLFYTPLGSVPDFGDTGSGIEPTKKGFILDTGTGPLSLDRGGNPEGSPLAGLGFEPRRVFWRSVFQLCRTLRNRPDTWTKDWGAFEEAQARALQEGPLRTAAVLLASRALAKKYQYSGATAILEEAAREIPGERDLLLRLGEYRLLGGDRVGGRAAVLRSTGAGTGGRNPYDAFLILTLDAALHGDAKGMDEAVNVLLSEARGDASWPKGLARSGRALLLFFTGQWDDPRFDSGLDAETLPPISWVRLWVSLKLGKEPETILAAARSKLDDNDAPHLGHLLEAECLRRLGRLDEALPQADETRQEVVRSAATSYEDFAWLPVAEWELGRCLLDLGRTGEAEKHLKVAADQAPATWFGKDARHRLRSGS